MLDVTVDWYQPDKDDWNEARQVYAYVHPDTQVILYIGKADYCSPQERWNGHESDGLFDEFERDYDLKECDTILGEVTEINGVSRVSVELLTDIEELLIWLISPSGNRQFAEPKRPDLRITCTGAWPMEQRIFIDNGD